MIAYLKGTVLSVSESVLTLVCDSGVGYEIWLPLPLATKLSKEKECALFTHLQVSEEALRLFGFESEGDKALFRLLLKVSGVGPKVALSILSLGIMSDIVNAIYQEDALFLTRAKGLGKRGAEKVILEIKDRLRSLSPFDGTPSKSTHDSAPIEEARLALLALGYKPQEADIRLKKAIAHSNESSTAELIKNALQS